MTTGLLTDRVPVVFSLETAHLISSLPAESTTSVQNHNLTPVFSIPPRLAIGPTKSSPDLRSVRER